MSDAALVIELEPDREESDPDDARDVRASRDRDLLAGRATKLRDRLDELFSTILRTYEDQADRADSIEDYWDCYNCNSNDHKYYNGISDIYFPIIHDAVNALVTRFTNQMFPQSGRYIEEVSADGTESMPLIALIEHYLRDGMFETQVMKPLMRTGIVEGQFNLYIDWAETERVIVSRETHGAMVPGPAGGEMEAPGEEIEDITEEVIREGYPVFEVLHDCDVAVWPATADSLDEAFAVGGGVAIVRHWTKEKIDKLVKQGVIRKAEARALKNEIQRVADDSLDIEKRLNEAVGIHPKGTGVCVWEVWTMLPLDQSGAYSEDGSPRLCRVFFGPNRAPLGAKRNPYWNDRCPLLSVPIEKIPGVFKGKSPISYVDSLQYEANDAINEGADAATLSAAPIVRRDPALSNGPLVFGVGAIWEGPKDAIDLLVFPDLTPRAQIRVDMAMRAIFQTLGVNPSMLPQQLRVSTSNQAEVAQEQQVDLLTTAEGVKVPVEGILNPAVSLIVDYDYQFRDKALTVRQFGEMGVRAKLEQVEPLVNRHGFTFIWRGGEQVKQAMMMQQAGTAFMAAAMQPQVQALLAKAGYSWNPVPVMLAQAEGIFGAWLGQQTIVNDRELLTLDPHVEDQILAAGEMVHVHPLDRDREHLQAHMQVVQATGDPHGTIRMHVAEHLQSMQMKAQASMLQAQAQAGLPPPGGPGGGPGSAQGGPPQPGAMPMGPHAAKGPPGMIHPDNAAQRGVVQMPRRN